MTTQAHDIRDMITRQMRHPELVTDELHLRRDLGMESLDHVEMVMDLEKRFNIDVADNDAEAMQTVGDVIRLVGVMSDG